MDKNYKGLIWTNHALQKMGERGIEQGDAWATWRRPDQSRRGKAKGTWVYYKISGHRKIEVVAKQNEKPPARRAFTEPRGSPNRRSGPGGKEWIILSVWSRSVFGKRGKKVEPLWKLVYNKIFSKNKKKKGGEIT